MPIPLPYGEVHISDLIPLAEAAERYGLSRITVAQAAREDRLQTIRVGRSYATTAEWMEAAIQAGKLQPGRRRRSR